MADQSLPAATGVAAVNTGEKASSTSSTGDNGIRSSSKGKDKIIVHTNTAQPQAAAGSEKSKKQQHPPSIIQGSERKKQQQHPLIIQGSEKNRKQQHPQSTIQGSEKNRKQLLTPTNTTTSGDSSQLRTGKQQQQQLRERRFALDQIGADQSVSADTNNQSNSSIVGGGEDMAAPPPTATGIALHTGEKVSSSTSSTGGNCSSSTSKGKIISQAAAGSEKKKQQYRQSFQVSEKKKQQLTTTNSTSADSSQLRTGKQQQQQQVRPSQLTTGKQHHPTATSSGHQSLTSRRSAISPHANINIDQIGGNQSGANNPNIAEEMVGSTASSNTGEERRSKEKLLRPSRGQEVHATTHMRVAREEKLTKSHSSSSYRNKIAHKNRGRDKDLSPPTNRQRHTAPSMAAHSTNDSAPSMGTLYLNTYARRNAKIPTAEEMNQAMQKMSLLGVGEDITGEEFTTYLDQLSCAPLPVDTSLVLDTLHVLHLYERHALYRIRAYKLAQGVPKEQLGLAELKACYTPDILEKEQYFCCYEEDGTLDWSFHPDYIELAELDDYQRLVPKNSSGNYGDLEYENWDEYREFFHSYEIEQEYLHYCEELSKKLEWLKEYLHVDMPLWGRISSRAAYQAIKIATGFPKISGGLAYTGYYELVQSMGWNDSWWKELDGVYFEIWRRVTKHKKIFRDALDEVYKLNRFPSRHHKMKRALEGNCSAMEKEFHICTANIDEEVSDDTAQELIAEAVQKRKEKPKYYEHYVRKKIQIAQAIGLIPEV